jgi:predicted double-glycine peptidase
VNKVSYFAHRKTGTARDGGPRRPYGRGALCVLLGLLLAGCAGLKEETSGLAVMRARGPYRYQKPVRSWWELQRENVVMQGTDYSCGSGALATLMRYYFEEDVTEQEILDRILEQLGEDEYADRVDNGLTLLDLKECAVSMGYQAVGARIPLDQLPKLAGPILVHLDRDDLQHFVVLKGVYGDRAFLADPSWGNSRLPITRFANEWTGVALVLGKKGMGLPTDHSLAVQGLERIPNEALAARRALYRAR